MFDFSDALSANGCLLANRPCGQARTSWGLCLSVVHLISPPPRSVVQVLLWLGSLGETLLPWRPTELAEGAGYAIRIGGATFPKLLLGGTRQCNAFLSPYRS